MTDAAVTYKMVCTSLGAILSIPALSMDVPDVTGPVPERLELTYQLTVLSGLLLPVTCTWNCCVLPAETTSSAGLTSTLLIVTILIGLYSVLSLPGVLAMM